MVDPNLNSIGIGFAQSNGIWYATQNFATYNPSNTPLTPTTTNSQPSRNTSNQAKPSTKSALATTTGPSMAVAAIITGLLGTGAFLVMRRRQAS
jgi:SCP-like extracellular